MKFLKKIMRVIFTYLACRNLADCVYKPTVNFYSRFTKKTIINRNCHFNGMSIQGGGVVIIGDNFHSGKSCMIITQNHNYEGTMLPYDNTYMCKKTSIGDNVWFGHHVIVLPGVHIGEGAIAQAGAIITKDVPKCAIVGGSPAQIFKYRNIEHYEKLKKEGKFN